MDINLNNLNTIRICVFDQAIEMVATHRTISQLGNFLHWFAWELGQQNVETFLNRHTVSREFVVGRKTCYDKGVSTFSGQIEFIQLPGCADFVILPASFTFCKCLR